MKSQGFGDNIEKFTKATGIKSVVDTISKAVDVPCGCNKRKETFTVEGFTNEISLAIERVRLDSSGFRMAED